MSSRVLVPIKRVIDYKSKIRVKSNKTGVEKSGMKMSMNPFCGIALEEAIRLKEQKKIKSVTAITIGDAKAVDILRTALAMGADNAFLLKTDKEIDKEIQPIHISNCLYQFIIKEKYDLCIMGKQSIDGDYNQTGQMLSTLLNWPQGAFLSKLVLNGDYFEAEKEIDGGIQKFKIPLQSILTCDLRLNVPRYPKLPQIMKAKKKPLEILEFEDFCEGGLNSAEILEIYEPPKRKGGVIVESVDELIDKLKNEAKVL